MTDHAPTTEEVLTTPPVADDFEPAAVAYVLRSPEAFATARGSLQAEHFHSTRCASTWQAMESVYEGGGIPELRLVKAELNRVGVLGTVVPLDWLAKTAMLTVRGGFDAYATPIIDAATARRVQRLCDLARQDIHDGIPGSVVVENLEKSLAVLRPAGSEPKKFANLIEEVWKELDCPTLTSLAKFGFTALDSMVMLERGDVALIGARPSMGKTALAVQFALNMAMAGTKVGFFSLEMPGKKIGVRMLSNLALIPMTCFRQEGWIPSTDDWGRLGDAAGKLKALPILMDDTPGLSVSLFRAKLRRMADLGVKVAFLDYLGLMSSPKGRTITNRENEVGAISRELKATAKECGVAVVALQQLSRENAKTNENASSTAEIRKPGLTSLRDSGSLEQDADVVMFLHRDDYYVKSGHDGTADIIVAKNRQGETGGIKLSWDGRHQRFAPLDLS